MFKALSGDVDGTRTKMVSGNSVVLRDEVARGDSIDVIINLDDASANSAEYSEFRATQLATSWCAHEDENKTQHV